ncbi:hypothetical protein [Methanomassiliicoccus luminyensis]|uniref:hypothetical protein n=1 Tax=Methanomassiliicoccus luminyensis TaxID=1080712 RepID=UPI0011CA7AF6|nr:hypothetical protein [Methanomassiliicoccus luminyensis]
MRSEEVIKVLNDIGEEPKGDSKKTEQWEKLDDIYLFLSKSMAGDIPVYVNGQFGDTSAFIYPILVPRTSIINDYVKEINQWNFDCNHSWGYGFQADPERHVTIFPPLWHTGSTILNGGEPLVFHRHFEGHVKNSYIELHQKFAQLLEIHWIERRQAYCRFDENGEYENSFSIIEKPNQWCCTLKKEDLEFILFLTDCVLIRVFAFSRARDIYNFPPDGQVEEHQLNDDARGIFGHTKIKRDSANAFIRSWLRGFQIIHITESIDKLTAMANGDRAFQRQYATFIADDFKHRRVHEISCNPDELDSNHVDTGKPFATSPAFFRPEVLSKYQQNPDKYHLGLDSIQCRGAWYLRRYDVNEQGQVNALLCDLAVLPYNEQLYWKSANEAPNGTISERSLTQDFQGEFFHGYDPLHSLIQILNKFPLARIGGHEVPIWKFHGEIANRKTSRLSYVVTDSSKEWTYQIIELATILNDGLCMDSITRISKELNVYDKELRSIKALEKCLETRKIDESQIRLIIDPLYSLQRMRNKQSAHGEEKAPDGNLCDLYKKILEDCDKAMRALANIINQGSLNILN